MKTNAPNSVSIIVLTYKQTEVLNLVIQGINQQTYTGDMEVIISDDGSPESIVEKNKAVLRQSKNPVKYVWQPDLGYRASAARNNGIRVAQKDLLIFLDGDIVPCPELVERHVVQHGLSNRLVAGNRTWIGEIVGINTFQELVNINPQLVAVKRGQKENAFRYELLHSPYPWRACFSANLSVRRLPIVSFDDRFVGWGPDDAEFSYRLCVKHGFTPIFDETIGSYHLESSDAVGNIFRKNNHESIVNYIRNTFLFYDECPGLKIEDVFCGLTRLRHDKVSNTWMVISQSERQDCNLDVVVEFAREWLRSNLQDTHLK